MKKFYDRVRREEIHAAYLCIACGFSHTQGCCIDFTEAKSVKKPKADPVFTIPIGIQLSVKDWIPDCSPTGQDNFFGVDRTMDPYRLAGVRCHIELDERYNLSCAYNRDMACRAMLREIFCNGGAADIIFFPSRFEWLEGEIMGPLGMVEIVNDDRICTGDSAYCLQMDTWSLWNNTTLVCEAPGYNGTFCRFDP